MQRPAVTKRLKNIFETGELKEEVVSSILEHTTQHGAIEGKTQETKVKYYNLDAFLSILCPKHLNIKIKQQLKKTGKFLASSI